MTLRKWRRTGAALSVPVFFLIMAGCGSSGGTQPATRPTVSIAASPASIAAGSSATLTVTASNASGVTVAGTDGSNYALNAVGGNQTVSPASTTTYTVTATGSGGSATDSTTITVTASANQPTVTLTASPTTITSGASATLTWTSTNATSVSFSPAVGTGTPAVNGTATVTPTATTTYTITATGAAGTTPATATATVTVSGGGTGGTQSPITHLIVLILQNHSFDNLFGTFPGGDGLNPSLPSYTQTDAAGNTVTPTLLSQMDVPNINHDLKTYTEAWDNGKMDKYAFTNGDVSMQYYDNTSSGTATDGKTWGVDTIWGYADQYALADHFYASAMYSEPAQELYMVAATTHDSRTAGSLPYYDNCSVPEQTAQGGGTIAVPLTETNVGDQMNTAGVSWVWYMQHFTSSVDKTCKDYVPQENVFQYFTTTQNSANIQDVSLAGFQKTLTNGTLPSVVFLTPAPGLSEHPGSGKMADAIEFVDNLVQAVKNSTYWQSTAIVMMYDESGGWYDHEPPPQLANSYGLGARVPVIVISPYAKPGYISHQQMDFVSIMRFIQWNWSLGMLPGTDQQAREQQSGDLCDLLTTPCGAP